jgi:iron complex transport system ATP-binding protein
MITARHLSLSIHGRTLLNDVSLDITPGLFTAIAGPNGAGKTSLLKILSRESNHYKGELTINGTPISKYSVTDLSKIRSVLPQSSHLQFPFTVQQIVEMGRHYQGAGRSNGIDGHRRME